MRKSTQVAVASGTSGIAKDLIKLSPDLINSPDIINLSSDTGSGRDFKSERAVEACVSELALSMITEPSR